MPPNPRHALWSLLTRLAILVGVVAIAVGLLAPVAWRFEAWNGIYQVAVAGAACLAGAIAAILLRWAIPSPQSAVPVTLLATMIRGGIPLFLVGIAQFRGGPLASPAFLYYLLLIYPVTLAAETIVSLSGRRPSRSTVG